MQSRCPCWLPVVRPSVRPYLGGQRQQAGQVGGRGLPSPLLPQVGGGLPARTPEEVRRGVEQQGRRLSEHPCGLRLVIGQRPRRPLQAPAQQPPRLEHIGHTPATQLLRAGLGVGPAVCEAQVEAIDLTTARPCTTALPGGVGQPQEAGHQGWLSATQPLTLHDALSPAVEGGGAPCEAKQAPQAHTPQQQQAPRLHAARTASLPR